MERKNVFTEALAELKKKLGGIPKKARGSRLRDKAKANSRSHANRIKKTRRLNVIAKQSRRVNRAA